MSLKNSFDEASVKSMFLWTKTREQLRKHARDHSNARETRMKCALRASIMKVVSSSSYFCDWALAVR